MTNQTTTAQNVGRIILGLFIMMTGVGHLSFQRVEFLAQVPPWLPFSPNFVVLASGIIEILLGVSLLFLTKQRTTIGLILAIFFVLVFPGNIAQLMEHRDAFGLDSDLKRWLRLPLQPVLIFLALWSTGTWSKWRNNT